MAQPFTFLIGATLSLHILSTPAAPFQPETFEVIPSSTLVLGGRILATPNLVAVAALEPPPRPRINSRRVVYLQSRPSGVRQLLWLADSPAGFGLNMVAHDGSLIIKGGGNLYFFRKDTATWVDDGSTQGQPSISAAGGLAAAGNFLISGMDVYSWPERQYLQTLQPPNFPPDFQGNYSADDVTYLPGSPAVISYANHTVWSYPPQGNGFDTNGVQVLPPAGTDYTGFGRRVLLLPPSGLILLVSAPYGIDSGAVHVYKRGDAGHWDYLQKLTAPEPTATDWFGSAIAADNQRIYISAPYRDEFKQASGAIFIYELPDLPPPAIPILRVFKEKITLTDTVDNANLGQDLAVHNRIIYASNAGKVIALHPPITLKPVLTSDNTLLIDAGTPGLSAALDSSTDLSTGWNPFPAGAYSFGFQMPFETTTPARFFRARLQTAF